MSATARRYGPPPAALEDAERFLRELALELAPADAILSTRLVELGAARGISARTLERARARLGLRSFRIRRRWYVDLAGLA